MPARYVLRRLRRFFIYRVLHVDDTPHRIALGVAIGIFVAWTPTIGLQMILTVLLSALLRANKVVGVPFVWISNPLTVPFIYGPSYALGRFLLGSQDAKPNFLQIIASKDGWFETVWAWWHETLKVSWPLWIGSVLMGLVLGGVTYLVLRSAVRTYREHRARRRRVREERRKNHHRPPQSTTDSRGDDRPVPPH